MEQEIRLISFDKIGDNDTGFLSVAQGLKHIPFEIKRVFWTYHTPTSIIRGNHAHTQTIQVIIALSGTIKIHAETKKAEKNFILENPNQGLLVPPLCWLKINFSESATMVTFASTDYDPLEYIRDYDLYKKIIKEQI